MNKHVSVVVACYNMGKYLTDAINSVLAQSVPPYEINVVDDGSTDNTAEVMERLRRDPRIRFFHQPNQGQAVAKNRGIRESRGDYIAFCDADDMWTPDKLEKQLSVFDRDPTIGVVYTNFVLMAEDGTLLHTPERTYYSGWISDRLLVDNFVNGMASIVRRQCFEKVGLFDESIPMGIDYDLWLRISAHYQIVFIDVVTYQYRQWPGQMSHRHKKRFECAVRIMNKFLDAHPSLVNKKTVRHAWAHTYAGHGYNLAQHERDRFQALCYYVKALQQWPAHIPAWKGMIKLALGLH